MQKITVAGHLGADPEVRHTPSGQKVTSFRIAANSRVKGEDLTTWYRISVWGDRYDGMMNYLKKGSSVIAVGDLRVNSYIDREGKTQFGLEVTADSLQFPPSGKPKGEQAAETVKQTTNTESFASQGAGSSVTEDDLPF